MYISENTLKPLSLQKTMSTTNVQNLLSNVFHPTFVYDTINQVYQSKLELVNIDTVSANTVSSFFASIGDVRSNVYVGLGAGNPHSNMVSSSNWYTTFIGAGAGSGTSNVSNSVFVGFNAGQGSINSTNTIAIGSNADGDGSNNIYIGAGTGVSGNAGTSNIYIGHGISGVSGVSNQLLVGPLVSPPPASLTHALAANYLLGGNFTSNCLGVNLSNPTYTLDVNGYARIGTNSVGGLGINTNPVDYTLNVNGDMQVSDGYGVFRVTHDSSGYSRTSLSGIVNAGGSPPGIGIATLQVNDGYFSASGTTTAGGSATAPFKKGLIMISAGNGSTSESYIMYSSDSIGTYTNILSHSTSGSNIPIFPKCLFTFTVSANSTTQTFTGLSGGIIVPGMVITFGADPGGTGGGISTTTYITAVNLTSATAGTITVSTAFNSTQGVYYNTVFPTTVGNVITFAGGNIVFSNAAALTWSVTYFPTP